MFLNGSVALTICSISLATSGRIKAKIFQAFRVRGFIKRTQIDLRGHFRQVQRVIEALQEISICSG